MLVEQRTYTTHPGKWREYLSLYEEKGLVIQRKFLGRMVGYYRTEVGPLNQIVQLWGYTDLQERGQRRAALAADPEWRSHVAQTLPLLVRQESKILVPASFFKPQWQH